MSLPNDYVCISLHSQRKWSLTLTTNLMILISHDIDFDWQPSTCTEHSPTHSLARVTKSVILTAVLLAIADCDCTDDDGDGEDGLEPGFWVEGDLVVVVVMFIV